MSDSGLMYFAGSSESCEVTVAIKNQQLLITATTDNASRRIDLFDLDVVPPLPSLPCEVLLNDGSRLEINGNTATATQLYKANKGNRILAWLESNKWACLAATALLPISFYWLSNSVIPTAAMAVANMIPPSVSHNIDEQVMELFDEEILTSSELHVEQQQSIHHNWQQLLSQLSLPQDQFELFIKKSEFYGANAFALPGGTVVVTDDLATLFVDHPDALNAIMLHEIGHVVERHSLRIMTESVGTSLMITYFFGDLEGMAELFSGTALTLLQNKFSRDMEREADQYAIQQLSSIGASPEAFVEAMTRLQESLGEEKSQPLVEYLSTHPQFEERIQRATQ
ncbi:M48 family metallopeptidase [Thalassotalea mangrovi]|uniref:M48 family metallopeptidase n=1 Tax=Thalassotalea mangrovi TaxID=2572245 RepID=A0A4U1B6H8_9GAMM|nr:M48 family metallopeptidase [Thalassotalea mangrovi]TKB45521.1 M48 family metallopeptidase [Thalassotalea mangrovi]